MIGVDPAKMELDGLSAGLLKNYQHVTHSVFDCVPKDFREKVEWLLIDIHAQPLITIKALEKLVTFPFAMSLKGALITSNSVGSILLMGSDSINGDASYFLLKRPV